MKSKFKYILFFASLVALFGFSTPFTWIFSGFQTNYNNYNISSPTKDWVQREMQTLKNKAGNINENVLRLALVAYSHARQKGYTGNSILTVIDYSKPSNQRRFWVFDLRSNRILFNTWVAHGKNSGGTYATSFSNSPGSLKSSLGVFVTGETYDGKNGYSLKLRGLEHGVNDYAYARSIVIHGAAYTTPSHVGRSWGCPAVEPSLASPIINAIKNRSVVFAYYPDRRWLSHSSFLA